MTTSIIAHSKAAIVASEGCGSDWRVVEEDELSSEELLVRAEVDDVDAEGYLHQKGDAAELLLRCGR
ncbi:hypothetical protein B296_00053201 [Ensete ventricosum]|uniref:Uncharacterized protein n=1 Tax=Ensete ventricosum TaxID=4639 RepID=A0A426WXM5_ENSVE|nr:hypothetical protein B296_00053201 [Ensete ventricosum]